MSVANLWRSGSGTNPVCDGAYVDSWTWPGTGCENCGHTEAEHGDDEHGRVAKPTDADR